MDNIQDFNESDYINFYNTHDFRTKSNLSEHASLSRSFGKPGGGRGGFRRDRDGGGGRDFRDSKDTREKGEFREHDKDHPEGDHENDY